MATEFEKYKLPQRWSLGAYVDLLVSLLPDGLIWIYDRFILGTVVQDVINSSGVEWQDGHSYDDEIQDTILEGDASGNYLRRLLSCFASELERFESACWSLLNQTDPGVATDLLEAWEKLLGLPEICFADKTLTIEERQRQCHAKLFDTAKTANIEFYETLADSLGFDVTVEEIPSDVQPRIMGVAIMGLEPMGGYGGNSILRITINSGTSDTVLLKCVVNKLKPAHVSIDWVEP